MAIKTSGGCVDPLCLDNLQHYGTVGSAIRVGYIWEDGQPVAVILSDINRIERPPHFPEHMHFSVEDFRLFAIALCNGGIPVPQLVEEHPN